MIINQQKSTQTYLTYQCTYDKNYKALTELQVSIISSQRTTMNTVNNQEILPKQKRNKRITEHRLLRHPTEHPNPIQLN